MFMTFIRKMKKKLKNKKCLYDIYPKSEKKGKMFI